MRRLIPHPFRPGTLRCLLACVMLAVAACAEAPVGSNMPDDVSELLARAAVGASQSLDAPSREALKQELLRAVLDHTPPAERAAVENHLRPEVLRHVVRFDMPARASVDLHTAVRDSLVLALLQQYVPAAPPRSTVDSSWEDVLEVQVRLVERAPTRQMRAMLVPGATEDESPLLVLPAAGTTPHDLQLGLRLAATYQRLWESGAKARERVVFTQSQKATVNARAPKESTSKLLASLQESPMTRVAGIGEGRLMSIAVDRQ